jgi:hypothetical protein
MAKNNKTPLEDWEQEQIFNWRHNNIRKYPELKYMYATLNGVRVQPGLRRKLKKQGLTKGVPDIDLPVNNKYYTGLHIELKRLKGGTASPEQKAFLQFLANQGRLAVVCKGHKAAIKTIKDYLKNI